VQGQAVVVAGRGIPISTAAIGEGEVLCRD
jgi:hypothetical protein